MTYMISILVTFFSSPMRVWHRLWTWFFPKFLAVEEYLSTLSKPDLKTAEKFYLFTVLVKAI